MFGIARTTGTPSAIRRSIATVGIAAAIESTVCSGVSRPPTSPSSASMSCGLTEMTTRAAPATASPFERVAVMPWRSASSSTRSCRRAVAAMSLGDRQPDESRPLISASPIFPAPSTAIRRSSTAMAGV